MAGVELAGVAGVRARARVEDLAGVAVLVVAGVRLVLAGVAHGVSMASVAIAALVLAGVAGAGVSAELGEPCGAGGAAARARMAGLRKVWEQGARVRRRRMVRAAARN